MFSTKVHGEGHGSTSAHGTCHAALQQATWRCPICLDLLYLPVVNSCGHAICFWWVAPLQLSADIVAVALTACTHAGWYGACSHAWHLNVTDLSHTPWVIILLQVLP